jgi:hypothetical protein
VRVQSSDRVVRHCAESTALARVNTLAHTDHREDPFFSYEVLPGPDRGGNGVADE